MIRMAIVGAGNMARVRGQALLQTGRVEIVGVAARTEASARACAGEFGSQLAVTDYHRLLEARPDAVLIEVPHAVQGPMVRWALDAGLPVLVGGALAGSTREGEEILAQSERAGLVVEAGYQARYDDLYEAARAMMRDGTLGRIVAVRTIALWDGDPSSWYYRQDASGGMPLTHMTYCFINPIRWLLDADPLQVSAFANRKKHTDPACIREETCIANLRFPDEILCSLTAGFVTEGGFPAWNIEILGTGGVLAMRPGDGTPGEMTVYRDGEARVLTFTRAGFAEQSHAFLDALHGDNRCRNTPAMTLPDLRVAEAIVDSAREHRTVTL